MPTCKEAGQLPHRNELGCGCAAGRQGPSAGQHWQTALASATQPAQRLTSTPGVAMPEVCKKPIADSADAERLRLRQRLLQLIVKSEARRRNRSVVPTAVKN